MVQKSHQTHFHSALRVAAGALARILDSLVRVSRRDERMNFARRRLRRGLTLDIAEAVPEPTPTSQPYLTNARLHIRPRKLEFNRRTQHFGRSVPSYQFQALFNSLFKVLCIFPSRYLFAIGLPPVFSLRWNLPPIRAAVPSNSTRRRRAVRLIPGHARDCHPPRCPVPRDFSPELVWRRLSRLQLRSLVRPPIYNLGCSRFSRPY